MSVLRTILAAFVFVAALVCCAVGLARGIMALANRERGVGLSDSDAWFHLTPEGKRHLRRGMRFAGGFLLCWVVLWAIAEYWPR